MLTHYIASDGASRVDHTWSYHVYWVRRSSELYARMVTLDQLR